MSESDQTSLETATFGGGCFWCIEAVFEHTPGVRSAVSGYMGGGTENPTYHEVCGGDTGHAEVVQVSFDPDQVSYRELLDVFFRAHDPTTLNRQGADVGPQYRSVVFCHSPEQKTAAGAAKAEAGERLADPVVTEITEAGTFYPAEDYHQDYYKSKPSAPYCQMVIRPKLDKLGLA